MAIQFLMSNTSLLPQSARFGQMEAEFSQMQHKMMPNTSKMIEREPFLSPPHYAMNIARTWRRKQ
ncbi:hypothetical protein [Mangrovicoccus sp. HB161399]|uniref:hypothetical protein n=1 Tax=Mangrovicoccus sp. HB161399 TaxID=2720392 RepID=UPI0015516C5E|nr:hypothetical protein [Mangrovicoccus sp. HB161399]